MRRSRGPRPGDVEAAVAALAGAVPAGAIGVVLGSGLGGFAAALEGAVRTPYTDLPGFPRCRVPGHRGMLHVGRSGGRPVAVFEGRVHLYEAASVDEVTLPVRLLRALEARAVVLTTSVGSVNASYAPGDIVLVRDQLNLTGEDPARAGFAAGEGSFPTLKGMYHPDLLERATSLAFALGVKYHRGVLAGVRGPSYETPAEVLALRSLGADVVCMSTVLEAMTAASCGLPLLGLAAVTNRAGALGHAGHEEVLRVAKDAGAEVQRLLETALAEMDWEVAT